jgi:hypothetical protein
MLLRFPRFHRGGDQRDLIRRAGRRSQEEELISSTSSPPPVKGGRRLLRPPASSSHRNLLRTDLDFVLDTNFAASQKCDKLAIAAINSGREEALDVTAWKQVRRFLGLLPERYAETHHLTRSGWVKAVDAPEDRVETWKVLIERGSHFGARKWWCIWSSPTTSREEREALKARYPIDGSLRYEVPVRVSNPAGPLVPARNLDDAASQVSDGSRWLRVIKLPPRSPRYWILGFIVLALLAIASAGTDLQHTYIGAYLLGRCDEHPAPRECFPLASGGF